MVKMKKAVYGLKELVIIIAIIALFILLMVVIKNYVGGLLG